MYDELVTRTKYVKCTCVQMNTLTGVHDYGLYLMNCV